LEKLSVNKDIYRIEMLAIEQTQSR